MDRVGVFFFFDCMTKTSLVTVEDFLIEDEQTYI